MKTGYHYHEEGKIWFRIICENGNEYEEPIGRWELVLDFIDGQSYYINQVTKEQIKSL